MFAILDNRKFLKSNSLLYESSPKLNPYRGDETLEEKMFYTYNQPNEKIAKDIYSFRYDDFLRGNRDVEVAVEPKFEKPKDKEHENNGVCGGDGETNICGGTNLFPIMNPCFNFREAAKNMILLEDHLFHKGKRCSDCIKKHCLTIEGFLEEAITLDKTGEYRDMTNEKLDKYREIFAELAEKIKNKTLTDEHCCKFAQQIRQIRKPLCQQFATFLK